MNQESKKISNLMKKKISIKTYEAIILLIMLIIITILSTIVILGALTKEEPKSTNNINTNSELERFIQTYNLITDTYYNKIDEKKAITSAIEGLLKSLDDENTTYFTKEQNEDFNSLMSGTYKGIGAVIAETKNNNFIIESLFKGSPSEKSGLKPNDIIISVNNKEVKELTLTETVGLIRDKNKETVNIVIKRNNENHEFIIKKEIIIIDSVKSKVIEKANKKIGYIEIYVFAENTYLQFTNQLLELERQDIDALIIDVRSNSGGYLDTVSDMLDLFFKKGIICYQMVSREKVEKYKSKDDEQRKYPIAVLMNEGSASASEILAIALKEKYNAKLIGKKTFGKGTVQTIVNYSDGSMFKYTIQKWLSPDGVWVHKKGIIPDYEVDLSKEYIENPISENDNQLQKALEILTK